MNSKNIIAEQEAFDRQTTERIEHGFIPDLRRLQKVDWFYNNVWRDPEMAKMHWLPRIENIIQKSKESGKTMLEIGCGMGMLSLEAARNGLDVTGLDVSQKSIDIANKYRLGNKCTDTFGSLNYICADFLQHEILDETYDSVVFFRSLHHLHDIDFILGKVDRVLKAGGALILSEPVRSGFNRESAQYAALFRMLLPTWIEYDQKVDKEWTSELWEEEVDRIFHEYNMEGDHEQSPHDNSISNMDDIVESIKKYFIISEISYSDAFTDKLLGGLRGPARYKIAAFLKFYDQYLIDSKILPPTSLELVAIKE